MLCSWFPHGVRPRSCHAAATAWRLCLRLASFWDCTLLARSAAKLILPVGSMCRSAGCNGQHGPPVTGYTKYSPPVAPPLCYPMPPTPMMTVGGRAAPPHFCMGCAQCARSGKPCQQVNKENTLGIMRSL